MRAAWFRLVLAGLAFAGWIGYLGYLVAGRPRTPADEPLVVSSAQLLASEVDVIAYVESPDLPVRIIEVLRPGPMALSQGQEVVVRNIDRAQARAAGPQAADPGMDFTGPGEYLIPLSYRGPVYKNFSVTPVPASPGMPEPPWTEQDLKERHESGRGEPASWAAPATRWPVYRIYPASAEARAQYDRIKAP